jgi:hypothetical protein
MTNCSWIVDDQNMVPITFRRIFLNQLEMRFSNLINDIKNMKYEESESELVVIHNKQRKGLITLICELYVNKIIGNQLIRYIFRNFETAYDSSNLSQYVEYWLLLLQTVMNIWIESEKQYLDEQIQYIKSKTITELKLKFLLNDILAELENKSYKPDETIEDKYEVNTSDQFASNPDIEDYDLQILSHGEYETTDSWFTNLDKDIDWDKFLLDLLQITLTEKNELELVKKLLIYMKDKSIYTNEQIKEKIQYIKDENDFSEYKYYFKDLQELETLTI